MIKSPRPTLPPPGSLTSDRVNKAFDEARANGSDAGQLVSENELIGALVAGYDQSSGWSDSAKDAFAKQWASQFTGAGFAATPQAQELYATLQKVFDLPVYPVG